MLKFLVFLTFSCVLANNKNVCRTFFDYYIKPISKNCWYNPDVGTDLPKLVTQHNYKLESYQVATEDGYTLQVFRLPNKNTKKGVVYLQHPAVCSAATWVDKGNSSLGYMLYHEGYDVWMGNFRGNFYSRNHKYLNPNTNQFWNYSYHELGIYDIPTQIDLIIKTTNASKIAFVGHSMSSTAALIYASLLPDHAEKYVNSFVLLCPAAYFKYITSPLKYITPFHHILFKLAEATTLEWFPHNNIFKHITTFCTSFPPGVKFCGWLEDFIFGWDWKGLDPSLLPVMLSQNPAGLSAKCFDHYAQAVVSKKFSFYDYGKRLNKLYYHSKSPPEYPLENIRTPLYLMTGTQDSVSGPKDTERVYKNLKETTRAASELHIIEGLNHVDFLYSKNVSCIVYKPVIEYLNKKVFTSN